MSKSNSEYMDALTAAMEPITKTKNKMDGNYEAIMKIYGKLLYQNTYGATMELFHDFDGKTRTREHLVKLRKQAETLSKNCQKLIAVIDDMPEKPTIS